MRVARPSDAETIARTMHLGIETYTSFAPAGWTPRRPPHLVENLADQLRSRHTWGLLADIGGEPAGHALMLPDWQPGEGAYLSHLFTRPAWWGTGLAGRLHDAFVARARALRYPFAWLATPAGNARARRFYERRGWTADTLLEDEGGLPMAIYGRPLLP